MEVDISKFINYLRENLKEVTFKDGKIAFDTEKFCWHGPENYRFYSLYARFENNDVSFLMFQIIFKENIVTVDSSRAKKIEDLDSFTHYLVKIVSDFKQLRLPIATGIVQIIEK